MGLILIKYDEPSYLFALPHLALCLCFCFIEHLFYPLHPLLVTSHHIHVLNSMSYAHPPLNIWREICCLTFKAKCLDNRAHLRTDQGAKSIFLQYLLRYGLLAWLYFTPDSLIAFSVSISSIILSNAARWLPFLPITAFTGFVKLGYPFTVATTRFQLVLSEKSKQTDHGK